MYLKKNRKGEIDNNADVQRNFVWNNEQINELIVTVLTDDYIPPVILGEEENSKLHIVDGGCRTAALIKFRYGNHKITSSIENSFIPYKKKTVDENGNITYVDSLFDIRNRTYEKLPEELREKFDEYQIETVIHEACDSLVISRYIKRYNNHVAMNPDQRAFTYIDRFAGKIRHILNSRFFVECSTYSEKDKIKGVVERIVVESMMCANHFEHWKTRPREACKFLNDNATEEEFDRFSDNLRRLEKIITEDTREVFNKKDSFIFLTLFDKFTGLGVDDVQFAGFLREFQRKLRGVERSEKGLLFDEIDRDAGTKDRQVISDKLDMLEKMMLEYLHVGDRKKDGAEEFIAETLGLSPEALSEEMDFYRESLDFLLEDRVKLDSRLRQVQNRPSLLALLVYSYMEEVDIDLERWLEKYAANHNAYFSDQKKNFLYMKHDFEQYLQGLQPVTAGGR